MAEELNFSNNNDEKNLLKIAADLMDSGDLFGAISMVNRCVEFWGASFDTYKMYGKIYGHMGNQYAALNCWFTALSSATYGIPCGKPVLDDNVFCEIYLDIASCFFAIGEFEDAEEYCKRFSARAGTPDGIEFLMDAFSEEYDEPDDDMSDIPDDMSVDDDELEDEIMSNDEKHLLTYAVDCLRNNDTEAALEVLECVEPDSENYLEARSLIAMAYGLDNENDRAEEVCNEVLALCPDNISALAVLGSVYMSAGKKDKACEVTDRLLALDITDDEDITKIASLLSLCDRNEDAYGILSKLSSRFDYDPMTLYLRAVVSCDCGKVAEAKDLLKKILCVHSDAFNAKLKLEALVADEASGVIPHLSKEYQPEIKVGSRYLEALVGYIYSSPSEKKKYDMDKLSDAISWVIDPLMSSDDALYAMAFDCALGAGLNKLVYKMLLSCFIPDSVKYHFVESLCVTNKAWSVALTCYSQVKCIVLHHVRIGKARQKTFLASYGTLVAKFCIDSDVNTRGFVAACEKLYAYCKDHNLMHLIDDDGENDNPSLVAALYIWSDVQLLDVPKTKVGICKYFEADREVVKALVPTWRK